MLPKIIMRFTSQYPKIAVTPVEANSTVLSAMVEAEEIDVVVDSFDDALRRYDGCPLTSERILLCVPAGNPINQGLTDFHIRPSDVRSSGAALDDFPSVPIERFSAEKFVLLKSGNDMYNRAMTIFSAADIEPQVLFSVDQMNISYSLVESGLGVCFVTDTLLRYGKISEDVCLYNISEEYGSRTLYIAYKKNKYCTRAMQEFIRIAREVIHN